MQGYKITVSGRVQGVGFRWFALNVAKRLKISGIVRNESNGDVEIIACGDKASVDLFLSELRLGPPHSAVMQVSCRTTELDKGFADFRVVY
jgi:acylphosphatase